ADDFAPAADDRRLHEAEAFERRTADRGQQLADRAGAVLAGGFGLGGADALAHPALHAIAAGWTPSAHRFPRGCSPGTTYIAARCRGAPCRARHPIPTASGCRR